MHMRETSQHTLRMLFWESTVRCNLACVHCRRQRVTETPSGELGTDEARALLNSAAALGRPIFVFSGGEPLLREDWETLAEYARSINVPTALATNGTLIDAALAERIAAAGFRRVAVSLDGADARTHDEFRGAAGAFARTIAGINALRQAGVPLQINATITRHNAHQLDGLYDLAGALGAEALHLFLLVPTGCGMQIAKTHQLAPETYEAVLRWICDRQGHGEMELRATCAPEYYRIAAERGMDVGNSRGCLCGISVVFVAHDGEVFGCGYLPVSCGTVRKEKLEDIWRNSAVLADLRDFDRLKGACGACEYKAICGGCRARAFAATGDYLAAEPDCSYTPTTG